MNIKGPATGNTFTADLQIVFDPDKLVRSISPIYIQITLLTTGATASKTITGCLGATTSMGGRAPGLPDYFPENFYCYQAPPNPTDTNVRFVFELFRYDLNPGATYGVTYVQSSAQSGSIIFNLDGSFSILTAYPHAAGGCNGKSIQEITSAGQSF